MKEKILIAVDCGKYATKAILKHAGQEYIAYFRTKMQEVQEINMDLQPGSYYVKYNNKCYLIGAVVNEIYSSYDLTKELELHKICTYTAIAQLLQKANLSPNNSSIHLAINIPISSFKDNQSKKRYLQFMENYNNPIMINVNNHPLYFTLENTVTVFEGVGIVFHELKESKNANIVVIDIGGLNTTYCTFHDVSPDFDSMTVANLGTNILKGKVGKAINERFGISASANDCERIIQMGHLTHAGRIVSDSHHIIEQLKEQHFNQIIEFAKSRDYTFNNVDIHFVGGGAQLLQSNIKKHFPHARTIINPHYANVKSFMRILEVKYGQ